MLLTPPKQATWAVAVVAAILGIAQYYDWINIARLDPYSVPLLIGGFVLLALGCVVRGL